MGVFWPLCGHEVDEYRKKELKSRRRQKIWRRWEGEGGGVAGGVGGGGVGRNAEKSDSRDKFGKVGAYLAKQLPRRQRTKGKYEFPRQRPTTKTRDNHSREKGTKKLEKSMDLFRFLSKAGENVWPNSLLRRLVGNGQQEFLPHYNLTLRLHQTSATKMIWDYYTGQSGRGSSHPHETNLWKMHSSSYSRLDVKMRSFEEKTLQLEKASSKRHPL